jgi:hypothetical protein
MPRKGRGVTLKAKNNKVVYQDLLPSDEVCFPFSMRQECVD